MFELMDNYAQEAVIKVVGVGGGGGNAVEHMVRQNIEGVEFIVAAVKPSTSSWGGPPLSEIL